MKYIYRVESLNIGEQKRFYFRLPEELRVVEIFLNSDVQSEDIGNRVIDYCIQVQNGILEEKEFSSNSCTTRIMPNYVQIKDRYAEENGTFSIETSELILLLEAFINEKKKYII